jgi:regulator of RNase E activity RraA
VVLDADGGTIVAAERATEVLSASQEREEKEFLKRRRLQGGELSYELDGLREVVEGGAP